MNVTVSATGVSSATLSFAGLAQTPDATVNFTSANGVLGGASTYASNNPQLLVTGSTLPALTNNILPWAVVNGTAFATYTTSSGTTSVGGLDTASFANSDGVALPAGNQPTQNIRLSAWNTTTPTLPAGGLVLNSLNMYDSWAQRP